MKTYVPKDPGNEREWKLIDASGESLGRVAVKVADMLRGKDKPTFARDVDTGAFVVVVNAKDVNLTGRKESQKIYQRYSGYRGGLKELTAAQMRERHPERIITLAVKGMLPKNNLSRKMMKRLKVYAGAEHPHVAQQVRKVEVA
ncbi:MAG: 50S ribosomal protein L13 [Verrucomicrobiota bacterium]